jgi:hypothetical protein
MFLLYLSTISVRSGNTDNFIVAEKLPTSEAERFTM